MMLTIITAEYKHIKCKAMEKPGKLPGLPERNGILLGRRPFLRTQDGFHFEEIYPTTFFLNNSAVALASFRTSGASALSKVSMALKVSKFRSWA